MAESSTVASLLMVVSVAESLMADLLVVLDSVAQQWVLVSVQATDVAEAHASVAAFVVLLARFVVCSQAADATLLHLADVQLQQLLLAVADATS